MFPAYRYLRFEKIFPVPIGVQTCKVCTRQGHGKKKSSGELGKKNQTNVGCVSSCISPLQRNILLVLQAFQRKARGRFPLGFVLTFPLCRFFAFAIHWQDIGLPGCFLLFLAASR
jgi:hypothetical protein